jgi:hypothetical protein
MSGGVSYDLRYPSDRRDYGNLAYPEEVATMYCRRVRVARVSFVARALGVAGAGAASASFHLMQIERVIGGMCGDTTQQAIGLRMRAPGQNLLAVGAQLVAYDAAGLNPVTLITFGSNVANGVTGSRVLITTPKFSLHNGPTPDFTLTNTIPASYMAAGKLAFQIGSPTPTIYWSVSWGGGGYTGANTGVTIAQGGNDADGNFGPPFPGPLPSASVKALFFDGAAADPSTNNAADYLETPGGTTFTNNAGSSGAALICIQFLDGFESGGLTAWSRAVP